LRLSLASIFVALTAVWFAGVATSVQTASLQSQAVAAAPAPAPASPDRAVFSKYCVTCHNQRLLTAGLALDTLDPANPAARPQVWEKVVAKLRAGSMPPPGVPRPDAATYDRLAGELEVELDRAWAAHPNPGRASAVHRLNRTEYNNAVRDLLGLDVDVSGLLPGDETADGSFDNYADALSISTAHMERYLSVARQVTRLSVGLPPSAPGMSSFEIPLHIVQDDRQSEDLPFGSRGGIAARYTFPVDGEYLIKVRLRRQYQDYIMGMGWAQQLDVRMDGKLLKRFAVGGNAPGRPAAASYAGDGEPGFAGAPEWEEFMQLTGDRPLQLRLSVSAGPRVIGVSFVRELFEPEGLPQPRQLGRVLTNDQIYMEYAAVGAVQISGPFKVEGPAKDTPGRRAIFVCTPKSERDEKDCATRILNRLAHLAYRRPVTATDTQTLLQFFDEGRTTGGNFDAGIQFALERMLVDPDFLLRIFRNPSPAERAAETYRLSDLDVASRLSFFLWSSIPDEQLLDLAEKGQLTRPAVLDQQVKRMLADPRAVDSLVNNFAAQWLNLRRVGEVVVHPDLYPSYDESLLEAFKKEVEMFVASTITEDRDVHELLSADYTFVNERLARHYEIPDIYGSRFRRVKLPNLEQRGGLLAMGALLATTSYPDRTSPVLRGKWLLNNIFGLPIPPPPPGVDTNLVEAAPGTTPPTIRERLALHRTEALCNSCHSAIDPMGFALENFDVIGAWRWVDESGYPVDTESLTSNGTKVSGFTGLRALLLAKPEQFPRTVTEKLMAYALGRPLDYYDRPTIRTIVRDASAQNYRWSALISGIVKSPTFLTRASHTSSN
jgi:cytochrome c5